MRKGSRAYNRTDHSFAHGIKTGFQASLAPSIEGDAIDSILFLTNFELHGVYTHCPKYPAHNKTNHQGHAIYRNYHS